MMYKSNTQAVSNRIWDIINHLHKIPTNKMIHFQNATNRWKELTLEVTGLFFITVCFTLNGFMGNWCWLFQKHKGTFLNDSPTTKVKQAVVYETKFYLSFYTYLYIIVCPSNKASEHNKNDHHDINTHLLDSADEVKWTHVTKSYESTSRQATFLLSPRWERGLCLV